MEAKVKLDRLGGLARLNAFAFILTFLIFTVADVFQPYWTQHAVLTEAEVGFMRLGGLSIAATLLLFQLVPTTRRQLILSTPIKGPWIAVREIGDPLLILRLFAFLCVWMTHSALLIKPNNTDDKWWHFLTFGCAHQGMAIFFTLSGYLMGKAFSCGRYPVTGVGIWAFYKNRMLRIIPLYLFAQGLVLLLVRPELLALSNWPSLVRLLTFNYYSSPNQAGPIGALWSLSTEMQFYLIVPFLYTILRISLVTLPRALISAAIVLVAGAFFRVRLFHLGTDWQVHRYTPLFINLDLFVGGMLLNGVVGRGNKFLREHVNYRTWLSIAFILMAGFYVCASAFTASNLAYLPFTGKMGKTGPGDLLYEYGPSLTAAATLVIIWCFEMGIIAGVRSAETGSRFGIGARIMKRLEYVGLITYGLYIWHPPILEAFGKILSPATSTEAYLIRNLGILVFGVFSIANVTYFLVEKPFAKLKRFVRRNEARASASEASITPSVV
jgi:peptidoglycan/LPS O-acetylase OafA/YrhL